MIFKAIKSWLLFEKKLRTVDKGIVRDLIDETVDFKESKE